MSLPAPTTSTTQPIRYNKSEIEGMEPALLALASKSGGDLRRLLYAFFGFLHRRTDFYVVPNPEDVKEGIPSRMGFPEGDAERLLLASFRQFPLRRMPRRADLAEMQKQQQQQQQQQQQRAKTKNVQKPKETRNENDSEANGVKLKIKDAKDDVDGTAETMKGLEVSSPSTSFVQTTAPFRTTAEGKQIPVDNGGVGPGYSWTQTLEETSVVLELPPGVSAHDLSVDIRPRRIAVGIKNKPGRKLLLDGELGGTVRAEESTWSVEGSALLLTFDKRVHTWWEVVVVVAGDDAVPPIDTTLVDSTRSLSEYDEATQAHVRKLVHDQRQKQQQSGFNQRPGVPLPPGIEYLDGDTLKSDNDKNSQAPPIP